MSAALTINESKLLAKLIDSFKDKDKLNDEHTLIKGLSKKSSLSDSDVSKLKLLLGFEQAKITARETKKKAKLALQMHENEKKQVIENRYRRFGLVVIESLKKLPENKATISLSDFLNLMLADENLNEKDKEWVSGFLQNDVMNGDPKD